jgi:hypothetical protein
MVAERAADAGAASTETVRRPRRVWGQVSATASGTGKTGRNEGLHGLHKRG